MRSPRGQQDDTESTLKDEVAHKWAVCSERAGLRPHVGLVAGVGLTLRFTLQEEPGDTSRACLRRQALDAQ